LFITYCCVYLNIINLNINNIMTTEFKLNYIESKLRKSGNKLPNSEITFIASQLLQQCNKLNKSVYDLEII